MAVETIMFWLIIGICVLAFLVLMMGMGYILIFMKTPALTYIMAMIKKSPILITIGKEQLMKFCVAKGASSGTIECKDGLYFVTENSHLFDVGSKMPTYMAFSRFGATMPPEHSALLQELRAKGVKVNSWNEFKSLIEKPREGVEKVDLMPFKTITMHDVAKTFPFNIHPSYSQEKVSNEVMKRSKMQGLLNNPITIFVIAGCLIAIIVVIWLLTKGNVSCACNCAKVGLEAVQGSLTG